MPSVIYSFVPATLKTNRSSHISIFKWVRGLRLLVKMAIHSEMMTWSAILSQSSRPNNPRETPYSHRNHQRHQHWRVFGSQVLYQSAPPLSLPFRLKVQQTSTNALPFSTTSTWTPNSQPASKKLEKKSYRHGKIFLSHIRVYHLACRVHPFSRHSHTRWLKAAI